MRERALGGGAPDDRRADPTNGRAIDVSSIALTSPAAGDLTAVAAFHRPRRRQRSTIETVMTRPAARSRSSRAVRRRSRSRGPRTCRAPSRAPAPSATTSSSRSGFPKLGVLQDDGWNCHQFHAGTEFFSDFGVYDVSLTVPTGWPLGATGVERETPRQRRRHDDASLLSGRRARLRVDDEPRLPRADGDDSSTATLPPVDMRLLLQPEHDGQAERHFDATRTTLKYYGEWYGAYPLRPHHDRRSRRGRAAPAAWSIRRSSPPARDGSRRRGVTTPEGVTVHEAGHQFWYGIVGNNEFEHAWMDEGFNTFSTARAVAQVLRSELPRACGISAGSCRGCFADIALSRETDGNRLTGYRRDAESDAQSTPSFRYFPATGGSITYNKTALWLNTMERWLGMADAAAHHVHVFHRVEVQAPEAGRLLRAPRREVAGSDLTWFFDQAHRSSNVFDYGVQDLKSARDGDRFRTTVVVRRYGEAMFPGGRARHVRERRTGDRTLGRRASAGSCTPTSGRSPALPAQVDPNRVLLLDVSPTNNSRTLRPQGRRAATKWSAKWMVWLQDCLLSWAALA